MLSIIQPVRDAPAPLPLHAPDGFFDGPVIAVAWAVTAIVIAIALRMAGRQLNERLVPAMGVFAAFIFAAQMLNFPVAGGTSGHLVGGALAAIVLGPWAAVLVMTAVVSLQALLFQDGGLIVMGVNLLNMAVLTPLVGYSVYRVVRRLVPNGRGLLPAGFVAGWVTIFISSVAVAFELSISGTSPLVVALPTMAGTHALIGIGEGLISIGALAVIRNARPDLLDMNRVRHFRREGTS